MITEIPTKGTEVISSEAQSPFDLSLAAIADTNLVQIAEQAEKRLAAFEKIWKGSLSRTNANDWSNQGGQPYLESSGAYKIARWLGVSWRPTSGPDYEDLGGGHYLIRYTGEFALGGAIITETGCRSSNEPFFNKSKGRELPASEVDKGDVMKAAYTNMLGRGISGLLGLRKLTWEDLKQHAQIDRRNVKEVDFGKSGRGAPQGKQPSGPGPSEAQVKASRALLQGDKPTITDPDSPATEAQVKAIHGILAAMGVNDQLARHEKVRDILGLEAVPTSMGKLSKAQASQVIKELQAEQGGEG